MSLNFFSSIYFKITNLCNMGCKHCYIPENMRKENNILPLEKLEYIFSELKDLTNNYTSFSIHGGEPLLLSLNYYKIFLEVFRKEFKDNYIDIQTSLYPFFKKLDKNTNNILDYLYLFKKYNVIFSVSYDFEGIRLYKNSYELYNEYFLKTIEILNEYNIKPVLIITLTRYMLNNEEKIYKWLLENKNKFSRILIEEYNDIGLDILTIKNSEIAKILINLYKLDKKNNFLLFPYFKILEINIKNKEKLIGKFNVSCQKENLVIEPDGRLTNCPDKSGKEYYGNIFEKNWLKKYSNNIGLLKSIIINKKKLNICKNCEYQNICNGGCPLKKEKIIQNNILDRNECSGYYPFLKYIEHTIKE